MIKKTLGISLLILIIFVFYANANASREVSFTQDDRDRLIRMETRIDGFDKRIDGLDKRMDRLDKRIDRLDKRIDELKTEVKEDINALRNLVYVVLSGMFALFGFILWDRRSSISPVITKVKELEKVCDEYKTYRYKVQRTFEEIANKNPEFANALKVTGLL